MKSFKQFNESKKIPRIVKINWIFCPKISVTFDNGEKRMIDFEKIVKDLLYADPGEPEYKLLDEEEFEKVEIDNNTLSWKNIIINILGYDFPFEIGSDVLYKWSEIEK